MAEAPLALLDELCVDIEAASAVKPRGKGRRHPSLPDGRAPHYRQDGTPHQQHGGTPHRPEGGGSRRRSASTSCSDAAASAASAAGGGGESHRRRPHRTSSLDAKDAKEDGTPRHVRRSKSAHDGHSHSTAKDREARRLERRVAEALTSDREGVEMARAERSLNARLRAAGVT